MIFKVMKHLRPLGSRLYSGISASKPVSTLKEFESQHVKHSPNLQDEPIVVDVRSYPKFEKIEDLNASHKRLMLAIKSRKNREKSGRILVEGKRLILDAIQSGEIPETVFFSRLDDLKDMSSLPKQGVNIFKLPYHTISLWSDVSTSPGVMGIFKMPKLELRSQADDCLPLTVICDNVREPGNLGAILRVAAGVGCSKVIMTKGCVDVWDSKVLRAAAGSHFRLPIHRDVEFSEIEELIDEDSSIFLADNNSNTADSYKLGQTLKDISVPILPYYNANFTASTSIVVVIGGETEGLSSMAMRLASQRDGHRLHIPLNNCVESLNTGTALGIILFEVKRQFSHFD